jgi:hypothetical protein
MPQDVAFEAFKLCKRCGRRHQGLAQVEVCCLFAPEPSGWCAWCGDDTPPPKVFCKPACAVSFEEETL